ncbi:uncharacterized protein LOC106166942 [Lingula anatina]|uniref:Uncharacterized protein LOC106166942 n=1 Tax=Lingula anatina TaxID=7574 RepID=A0A1S3ISK7_LINAN|nr:uncharacterized protein LOC106166942 [Lingula anatina]XP_013401059.1 uncharacterized protein LOC106166942 [Lingula anatina]|eukprot:XP_013401058.1 uncharacterized protein LOC106166942 [Lingula anatina]
MSKVTIISAYTSMLLLLSNCDISTPVALPLQKPASRKPLPGNAPGFPSTSNVQSNTINAQGSSSPLNTAQNAAPQNAAPFVSSAAGNVSHGTGNIRISAAPVEQLPAELSRPVPFPVQQPSQSAAVTQTPPYHTTWCGMKYEIPFQVFSGLEHLGPADFVCCSPVTCPQNGQACQCYWYCFCNLPTPSSAGTTPPSPGEPTFKPPPIQEVQVTSSLVTRPYPEILPQPVPSSGCKTTTPLSVRTPNFFQTSYGICDESSFSKGTFMIIRDRKQKEVAFLVKNGQFISPERFPKKGISAASATAKTTALSFGMDTDRNRACPGVLFYTTPTDRRTFYYGSFPVLMEPATIDDQVQTFPARMCAWKIQKMFNGHIPMNGISPTMHWSELKRCCGNDVMGSYMTCVEQQREVPVVYQCLRGQCPHGYNGPRLKIFWVNIPVACLCKNIG